MDIPKKTSKTKLIAFRVSQDLFERIEKLRSNKKNNMPEWFRLLIERELDSLGA